MNQHLTPQLEEWLSIRDEHIRQLQQELTVVAAALKAAKEDARDLTRFKQEYAPTVTRFQQEANDALQENAQIKGKLSALEKIVAVLKEEKLNSLAQSENDRNAMAAQTAELQDLYAKISSYDGIVADLEKNTALLQEKLEAEHEKHGFITKELQAHNGLLQNELDALRLEKEQWSSGQLLLAQELERANVARQEAADQDLEQQRAQNLLLHEQIERANTAQQEILNLKQALAVAESALIEKETAISALKTADPTSESANNPALERAEQEIETLKSELKTAMGALKEANHNAREVSAVRQEHVAYVTAFQQKNAQMEQEITRWQHDYEQLRIQKGGFGFKALFASGLLASLVGLALGWLLFRQRDPNELLFQQFKKETAFNLEYNLSHQQYDAAQKIIETAKAKPAFAPIQEEISMIGNLINAVRLQGDSTLAAVGYSVVRHDTLNTAPPKPVRSLVIAFDGAVNLHTEAMYNAPVLTTLKKKDKVEQWDRTPEMAKLRTTNSKGKKGVAEDYWYEVETPDGAKGWVFGFFTNASANRFKPDVPDSVAVSTPPTVPQADTTKHH